MKITAGSAKTALAGTLTGTAFHLPTVLAASVTAATVWLWVSRPCPASGARSIWWPMCPRRFDLKHTFRRAAR